jgi:hypothetical protein
VSFKGLTADYTYGAAEQRNPPRKSTIFKVNPKKPFGLETVKYQMETEAADEFDEFGSD